MPHGLALCTNIPPRPAGRCTFPEENVGAHGVGHDERRLRHVRGRPTQLGRGAIQLVHQAQRSRQEGGLAGACRHSRQLDCF